jgi:hypothetical protein
MNRVHPLLKLAAVVAIVAVLVCIVGPHQLHAGMLLATVPIALPSFNKLDEIPEAFRPAYREEGGKFVPIVEDASGLKSKNADLLTRLTKATERAKILGDRTPEEIQADLEFAKTQREKAAREAGDFETLKGQMAAEHQKALEKVSGRGKKLEGKLYKVMAEQEAERAIVAAGGNPKVLLPHILPFIKPFETDDDITVKVVDGKGTVRIADQAGTEMTIAQLVEQFKADEAFGVAFKPSDAAGSGARGGNGGAGAAGAIVLIPKNATPQEYRRLKDDAEKRGVPYRIAS